jgi:hypothetical protein
MHDSWFDTQDTMREWIAASQAHQAWGVRTMTRAFRRQSDRIVSTAVHLLIDAWPSGWMKALVDVDRRPKPAYFEYRDALTPLMVDIRTDRLHYFSGEKLALEFWVCNDRRAAFAKGTLVWEVLRGGQRVFAQTAAASIPSFGAAFQGYFHYQPSPASGRERLTIRLGLKDPAGNLVHDAETEVELFPSFDGRKNRGFTAGIVGRRGGRAWKLAEALHLEPRLFSTAGEHSSVFLVDDSSAFEMVREPLLRLVREGGAAILLEQAGGAVWRLDSGDVTVRNMRGREFVSRRTGHPLMSSFQPFDFSYWYDKSKDYIEYVANAYLDGPGLVPILLTADAPRPGDPDPKRRTMPVAAEVREGRGSIVITQLKATDKVEYEPAAAAYYQAIIDRLR